MVRCLRMLFVVLLLPVASIAARDYPKYCCTDAGALGPYDNDSVPEGGACFGTDSQGKRHEGRACYGQEGKGQEDGGSDTKGHKGNKGKKGNKGFPKYCCTDAGALGPYDNDSVPEGGACFGTDSQGQRHEGRACYGSGDGE